MADLTIRKTRFHAGFSWLAEAARLLAKNPLMWLLMAIVLCCTIFVFYGVFALSVALPKPLVSYYAAIGLGSAVLWILCFPLFGGLLLSAEALDKDNRLPIRNIYAGFRYKFRDLAVLSVFALLLLALFSLLAEVAMKAIAALLVIGFRLFGFVASEVFSPSFAAIENIFFFLPRTVNAVFLLLLLALVWSATALVVLNNKKPLAAILGSLRIFWRNWLSLPLLWLTIGLPIFFLGLKWYRLAENMPDLMPAFLGCYIGLLPILSALLVYVGHRHIVATREDEEKYD
ncbi:hypothetical protein [Kingella denitrificans]|uniref:hypothetical protein n=1 Tax=Kingella denitrificans TaxID=502 RepID=UPI0028D49FA2|nr:hypothetical protein [Kingella denitrificans]